MATPIQNFPIYPNTLIQLPNIPDGVGQGQYALLGALILGQQNTPMGVAPTGTVSAAGVLALGTALDAIYGPTNNNTPGIWLYFPATGSMTAGWYWCVMTSTTAGQVYLPAYSGVGIPSVGSTAAPASGGGAYTGVTSQVYAPVVAVPAGMIQPNGVIRVTASFTNFNSAGAKTMTIAASAAQAMSSPAVMATQANTTNTSAREQGQIGNAGVWNSQIVIPAGAGFTAAASTPASLGVNTQTSPLYIGAGQINAVATDWSICQGVLVELIQS